VLAAGVLGEVAGVQVRVALREQVQRQQRVAAGSGDGGVEEGSAGAGEGGFPGHEKSVGPCEPADAAR
jgi:hypothetical protein